MTEQSNYDVLVNYNEEVTDGMILYHIDRMYDKNSIFKNKPGHLNTVDLIIHVTNDKTVLLCVLQHYNSKYKKQQKFGNSRSKLDTRFRAELKKISNFNFSSLKAEPSILSVGGKGDVGLTTLADCDFNNNDIKNTIINGGACDFIVECIWQNEKQNWKILKTRPDKQMPNGIKTVLDNFELSINPINKSRFYNPDFLYYKYEKDTKYASVRYYMSDSISNYIAKSTKHMTINK